MAFNNQTKHEKSILVGEMNLYICCYVYKCRMIYLSLFWPHQHNKKMKLSWQSRWKIQNRNFECIFIFGMTSTHFFLKIFALNSSAKQFSSEKTMIGNSLSSKLIIVFLCCFKFFLILSPFYLSTLLVQLIQHQISGFPLSMLFFEFKKCCIIIWLWILKLWYSFWWRITIVLIW